MINADLVKELINNGPSDDLRDQIKGELHKLAVKSVAGIKETVVKLGKTDD